MWMFPDAKNRTLQINSVGATFIFRLNKRSHKQIVRPYRHTLFPRLFLKIGKVNH